MKNDLGDLFDEIIVSSEIRLTKEDPAIYEFVLRKLGVTTGEVVMTDDNPANIRRAEAAGIKGFVFKNASQLEKDFINLGLISPLPTV